MAISTGKKSFIENVNIIANATQLATGDVIEDANAAKDAAIVAALESAESAENAYNSEEMAEDWAIKPYNSIVEGDIGAGTDKYSSYHWSEIAKLNAGDVVINDVYTSTSYTWSSTKIDGLINNKSESNHNHSGIYEPIIVKNTAFNRNLFTGTNAGSAITVARGDHLHNGVYELSFAKGSAFNKNFGTTTGTTSQGDHNHNTVYMPFSAQNSAYNKPFVVDTQNPGSEEIPRGNHFHTAEETTHNPAGNITATSGNVQGAISQLDGKMSNIKLFEKTKIDAGLADDTTEIIPIVTADVPVIIDANLIQNSEKNALYNNNGIEISYDSLTPENKPGAPGTNLIEGWFHTSLTINAEADTEYVISPILYDGVSWIEMPNCKIVGGATTGSPAGPVPLSFSTFIGNLYDKNALNRGEGNYYKIGLNLYSSTTNNVSITGMIMNWAGQGEGSMVYTGQTIDHSDLTGLGAGTIHAIADISGLDTALSEKIIKVIPNATNNIATLDAVGNVKDSGVLVTEFSNKMNIVAAPVLNNFVTMDSSGNSKESGMNVDTFAPAAGNALQTFEVSDAINGSKQAVNKLQVEANMLKMAYLTDADMVNHSDRPDLDGYATHVEATNPHGITNVDIGAAATTHVHDIADVTGLADELVSKIDKVGSAVQGNIVEFGSSGVIADSGFTVADFDASNKVSKSGDTMTGVLELVSIQPQIRMDETDSPNGVKYSILVYHGTWQMNVTDASNNYIGAPLQIDMADGIAIPTLIGSSAGWAVNGYTIYHTGNFDPSGYLPLSGGTMTGPLAIKTAGEAITIGGVPDTSSYILGKALDGVANGWYIGRGGSTSNALNIHNYIADVNISLTTIGTGKVTVNGNEIYHTGNFSPASYLPLAGGTMTGNLVIPDGKYIYHSASRMLGRNASAQIFVGSIDDPLGEVYGEGVWSFEATPTVNGSAVWTAGNDGIGSGLNADLFQDRDLDAFIQLSNTHATIDPIINYDSGSLLKIGTYDGDWTSTLSVGPTGIAYTDGAGDDYTIWHSGNFTPTALLAEIEELRQRIQTLEEA